jgi:hypothetical protein
MKQYIYIYIYVYIYVLLRVGNKRLLATCNPGSSPFSSNNIPSVAEPGIKKLVLQHSSLSQEEVGMEKEVSTSHALSNSICPKTFFRLAWQHCSWKELSLVMNRFQNHDFWTPFWKLTNQFFRRWFDGCRWFSFSSFKIAVCALYWYRMSQKRSKEMWCLCKSITRTSPSNINSSALQMLKWSHYGFCWGEVYK